MAKFSLRRYDTQARLSAIIALASIVTLIALAYCVFRGTNWTEFVIYHGRYRKPIVYLAAAANLLLATIGFGLGFNSAGQRRNDKQQLSWIGFFVGAGVIVMTFVLLYMFRSRGEQVV
ncbi:MAG: hypothetical protein ACYTF1_12220 [Planctomycetota bacterium]